MYCIPNRPVTRENKDGKTSLIFCTGWHDFSIASISIFLDFVGDYLVHEEKHKIDARSLVCADGKHPSEAKLELEHSNRSDEDVAYIDSDEMSHGCLRGPVLRALGFLADATDDKRPEYYSEEEFKEAKYLAKSLHDKVYAFDYTCL